MNEYFNNLSTDLAVPANLSPESSGIFIIDHVVNNLSPQFRFGYYTLADMYQYGWQFALELLAQNKYDSAQALEKYVYVHVFRRFFNLKRDKYFRNQPPCARCPLVNKNDKSLCTKYADRMECEIYSEWQVATSGKKTLMGVSHEYIENFGASTNTSNDIECNEMYDLIDDKLPSELRSDYRRLLDGAPVPETRRKNVRAAIRSILEGSETTDDGT